jgi:transposase
MGRPYSMDLRQRAMDRLASGDSCHDVAAALMVAPSSVIKWAQRHRQTGSVAPGKMGGHRPHAIAGSHRDWVLSKIEGPGHVTLEMLAAGLLQRGLKVHPAGISRFLHREGRSFKKTILPAEQNRPKLVRQRERWKRHQDKIDRGRLVFIDGPKDG